MEMAVSVDSLLKLPQGAAYTRRSGQANIRVATRGDTVYITGTCDSLQRRVDYYEALYHAARAALKQRESEYNEERRERARPGAGGIFLLGLLCGGMTLYIIKNRRR